MKYITQNDFRKMESIADAEIKMIPEKHYIKREQAKIDSYKAYTNKIASRKPGNIDFIVYTYTRNEGTGRWPRTVTYIGCMPAESIIKETDKTFVGSHRRIRKENVIAVVKK